MNNSDKFLYVKDKIINIKHIVKIYFFDDTNNIAILLDTNDDAISINIPDDDEYFLNKEHIINTLNIVTINNISEN